jgi:DNA-binding MarR family transcriptional regulator
MAGEPAAADTVPEALESRLGYLLKHAQLRHARASDAALAPFGIDARELAVLVLLVAEYPLSQLEAAGRLGVDRTTMMTLVDTLEGKGLVARHRSPSDRRRNIVQVTDTGQDVVRRAEDARQEAELRFLAPLERTDVDALWRALRVLAREE